MGSAALPTKNHTYPARTAQPRHLLEHNSTPTTKQTSRTTQQKHSASEPREPPRTTTQVQTKHSQTRAILHRPCNRLPRSPVHPEGEPRECLAQGLVSDASISSHRAATHKHEDTLKQTKARAKENQETTTRAPSGLVAG